MLKLKYQNVNEIPIRLAFFPENSFGMILKKLNTYHMCKMMIQAIREETTTRNFESKMKFLN